MVALKVIGWSAVIATILFYAFGQAPKEYIKDIVARTVNAAAETLVP